MIDRVGQTWTLQGLTVLVVEGYRSPWQTDHHQTHRSLVLDDDKEEWTSEVLELYEDTREGNGWDDSRLLTRLG